MSAPRLGWTLLLALLAASGAHAAPPAAAQEIAYLLDFVRTSGCSFDRNGTLYEAAKAADHLATKYRYFDERRVIETAEDFIARAATASSMTGRAYRVTCGTSASIEAHDWLTAALRQHRTGAVAAAH